MAQVWARQAPAQERRAPTIGAALLQTGSGPALTRLLSYNALRRHDLVVEPRRRAYQQENQCQRRTGKSTKKRISAAQDEGMGPLVSIRAFSDRYQGESIEHSLMAPPTAPRGKEEYKMLNSMCSRKLTCLLCACDRDFESDIVGV